MALKPFLVILAAYALVLIGGGVTAYIIAPEGANKATALIVPAACSVLIAVAAVLSSMLKKCKPAGMVGIHVGLVLPLLFAAAFFHRGFAANGAVEAYQEQRTAYEAAGGEEGVGSFRDFLIAQGADEDLHDKSYLRNTLFTLGGASVVAFGLLLMQRPKASERAATDG